jgi:hypothetical protein
VKGDDVFVAGDMMMLLTGGVRRHHQQHGDASTGVNGGVMV